MNIDQCQPDEALRFFNRSKEMLAILHLDGSMRRYNSAWERALGYGTTELVGRSFFELVHPDCQPAATEHFESLVARGSDAAFAVRCLAQDGSYRWISWSLEFTSGEPFVHASGRDVTEQVAADQQLYRNSEILNAVLQAAPIAIWACDVENRVQFWNPCAESVFGWAADEVLNSPPPHLSASDLSTDHALNGVDLRRHRKDGSLVDVEMWTVPLHDVDEARCGTLGICVDVTEQKRREEALRRAQKAEALGQLAAGISRDFSNLLTVIGGYTGILLARKETNSKAETELKEISSATQQALFICGQLTAFKPRALTHLESFNVNDVVREMLPAVKRLVGERVAVSMSLADNLNPVFLDRAQMGQLLLNLTISAYGSLSGSGDVLIETRNSEAEGRGNEVLLTVSHTGQTAGRDKASQLFEQYSGDANPAVAGGLGLFTASEIASRMGGDVQAFTDELGTSLRVSLPTASIPLALEPRQANPVKLHRKLLLVEDDSMVREFMRIALEDEGFEVLEAESGSKALEMMEHSQGIDLLITDLVMPEMTGVELYRRLKVSVNVKALFVSGYPDEIIMDERLTDSGTSFLAKPFTIDALIRRVNHVLETEREPEPAKDILIDIPLTRNLITTRDRPD